MTALTPPAHYQEEVELFQDYNASVVRRLGGFVRPYASAFLVSLVLMLIHSLATVAGPYLIKFALDEGLAAGSTRILGLAVLFYLGTSLVSWAVTYVRVNLMIREGQAIIFDLRARLFDHLQSLSLSFFSRYGVGRVIARVVSDVSVVRQFIIWALLATARDLVTVLAILIAMLSLNLRLSLLTFTVLPLMIAVTVVFRRRARRNYRIVRAANSWVNAVLAENINGIRVIQAFSRQARNFEHFKTVVNQHNLTTNLNAARLSAAFFPSIDVLGALAVALVVWIGGAAAIGAEITAGTLVAFILYIERFFEPLRNLSQRYDQFQATMAGGERIFSLLDTPVEVEDAEDAVELPTIRGQVSFEGVSFHYPDDPSLVLEDINLQVKAGMTVALVGHTGAGKTTLIKLLSRFHDPTAGRVRIDGVDLRTVTQASLRRQMGIVLQDPFLFSGSVAENIRFGKLAATEAEIEAAAAAVGAHDFVRKLRRGYKTPVEEGGAVLSVGQQQLISFARALIADPRILILDEATSSVDTQTELAIQRALSRLLQDRTAFVIAHRLSTIVNADLIVVLEDGGIVERGTHGELLAHGGRYAQLYTLGFRDSGNDDAPRPGDTHGYPI